MSVKYKVFISTFLALNFIGCSLEKPNIAQANITETPLDNHYTKVVQTSSYASGSKLALAAKSVLTPIDTDLIKKQNVVIEHIFSNGFKWRFRNVGNHVLENGDVAVAATSAMPEIINILEKELKKRSSSLTSQSLTLSPTGCSAYILWWCINPTSNYLWTTSVIPYKFNSAITAAQQNIINSAVAIWNSSSNGSIKVKWVYYTNYTGVDRPVEFQNFSSPARSDGSYTCGSAYVGYQGRVFPGLFFRFDYIAINTAVSDCYQPFVINHEMGHVIGLAHEHARCDRDNYITVQGSAVEGKLCGGDFTTNNTLFDFDSIMLYSSSQAIPLRDSNNNYIGNPNFTGDTNFFINTLLSVNDIAGINKIYQGR